MSNRIVVPVALYINNFKLTAIALTIRERTPCFAPVCRGAFVVDASSRGGGCEL